MPSTAISPPSLHDALPIFSLFSISSATQILDVANLKVARVGHTATELADGRVLVAGGQNETGMVSDSEIFDAESKTFSLAAKLDRKSTRLNSSHTVTSYAVHRYLTSFPTRRSSDLLALLDFFRDADPGRRQPEGCARGTHGDGTGRRQGARGRRPERNRHGQRLGNLRRREQDVLSRRETRSEEHTSELQSHSDLVCRPPLSHLLPYTTLFRSSRSSRFLPRRRSWTSPT